MFERYTEKARRVIFFARYEASQFGSPYIETEHLLLGLLREDKSVANALVPSFETVESVRRQIESRTVIREKVSTSVDLPLSNESKRVLAYAAEEAERLSHKHIGTEHLALGLMREEKCFAAEILHQRGVRLAQLRERFRSSVESGEVTAPRALLLAQFSLNLIQKAADNKLGHLVGRQAELDRLVQVLGRATKKNAVLVGPRGVGRKTIVHGLAQRIANGAVPAFLQERTIVAVDLESMITARRSARPDSLRGLVAELTASPQATFFIEEFYSILAAPPKEAWLAPAEVVKSPLLEGSLQGISLATAEEYRLALERHSWLDRCFTPIEIKEPGEKDAIAVLQALKPKLEDYHSVSLNDEVLHDAVKYATLLVPNRSLPDKAIDLIDEAGAFIKARAAAPPPEIIETRLKIRWIVNHMESAIANHEFEKARFYSEEERKHRRELDELNEKYKSEHAAVGSVTREALEEVLAQWTGKSVEEVRKLIEQGG